jgi:peptidoglycan/LPS O-acetylase OafA/YrhL
MIKEGDYFKQLDGFRFLSILAVMVSHYASSAIVDRIPLGFGVLFFFVLSSFLITRILLRAKQSNEARQVGNAYSLRQFYIRRFLRIFPIYYLTVAFFYVINLSPCREVIGSLLTYTLNLKIASGVNAGSFNHLWSLAVEEQFYIFFPFFVFFIPNRHMLKGLIFLTAIGLLGRAGLYLHNSTYIPYSNFNTISCLDSLGIGGMLAWLSIYRLETLKKIIANKFLAYGSMLLFVSTAYFSYFRFSGSARFNFTSMITMRFFFNVMSFWILGKAVTFGFHGMIRRFLENRVVVYLGRISYGMYIYHLFVPVFVRIIANHFGIKFLSDQASPHLVIDCVVFGGITIAIASASWFVIERPINNLKKYFAYNKKTPTVPTSINLAKNT